MNTTGMHIPSNKVRDIERYCLTELEPLYPNGEVRMFVRMLFEEFLGWNHTQLLLRREETVNQSDLLRFHWAVEELKRHKPIQYIIGHTDFCGCRIELNSSTLIPRPETEEIVLKTTEILSKKPPRSILDLCTGSGCIAIALAKHWPNATVTAVDISEQALQMARRNADSNGTTVTFIHTDLLSAQAEILPHPVDLIVSNPPYVREQEKTQLQRNVLDWEPEGALFVPDTDPLLFYRAIAQTSGHLLSNDGTVVVEINEQLAEETLQVFAGNGFAGEITKDFRGKNRALFLRRN